MSILLIIFSLWTFSTAIEIVLELLPKNMTLKMPATRKVVGLWLCFYATIRISMHLLRRGYFLCYITISNNIKHFCFVVLQGHKQLAIAICKDCYLGVTQYVPMQQSNFHMLLIAIMTAMCIIFMLYCKEQQQKWWLIATNERETLQSNNQPNFYVASQEQATITKQQHWSNPGIDIMFTKCLFIAKNTYFLLNIC